MLLLAFAQVQTAAAAIVNDAVASATYNAVPVDSNVASASVNVSPFAPALLVTKTALLNDDDGTPGVSAGDTVDFQITVQNSGNVDIINYALTDTLTQNGTVLALTSGPTLMSGDTVNPGTLDYGETWVYDAAYTLTQDNINDGSPLINTAVASGTGRGIGVNGWSSVTVYLNQVSEIEVTKTATVAQYTAAGETVTWDVTVANAGTTSLLAITVSDPVADAVVCPTSGDETIATLNPGAAETCTASRVVTASDMIVGSIDNTATATGQAPGGATVSDSDSASVPRLDADLVTVKTLLSGNPNPQVGDTVTFQIAVTNNGPADATSVALVDTLPAGMTAAPGHGVVSAGFYDIGTGMWTIGTLAAGASATLVVEGTIDPGVSGAIMNVTTAAAGDQSDPTTAGDDLDESVDTEILPILATDDDYATPIDSSTGQTAVLNVLDNDSLDSLPIAPGSVTLAAVGTLPAGITLNPDGTVDVAQYTDPGDYSFDYEICETANPLNCDTATVTLTVVRPLPKLSGTVFFDANGDGIYNGADTPLPGYEVRLVKDGVVVDTRMTDINGDYEFSEFDPGTYDIVFIDADTGIGIGVIRQVTVAQNDVIEDQDMPVDPSGIVYDAVTLQPVQGAIVTLTTAGGTPLPDVCLLPNQQGQVTRADGTYRFDIFTGADPLCPDTATEYDIEIIQPAGYLAPPSPSIPPESGMLHASICPTDPFPGGSCHVSQLPAPSPPPSLPAPYYLAFLIGAGDPHIANNHIPLDPQPFSAPGVLSLSKVALSPVVRVGDPVAYVLKLTNPTSQPTAPVDVVDTMPPGFVYVAGSGRVDGNAVEPVVAGRVITFENISVPASAEVEIALLVRVSAGVLPGDHVNEAQLRDAVTDAAIGPVARATVRVEAEHIFDCGEVIGKVFDDRNANGYQDEGELGLPGVRIATVKGVLITTDKHGRYSVPCADLPDADIGSNFILKLDERTLPTGFRVTTENPRVVRLTRGKVTKLNFGASVSKVVTVNLNDRAFRTGSAQPVAALDRNLERLVEALTQEPSVLRINYYAGSDGRALATRRLRAVRAIIDGKWRARSTGHVLPVETRMVAR
ncbi:MAG: DUF11 domain-containing protein [Brucellaceae bacterium]|nr:DUF11 domain-containing protein [Brucellaceae bacterium]